MTKEDMIYDLLKSINSKLDQHINNKDIHGKGMSIKEWSIFAGIVTTICTTATTIVLKIF